MRNLELAQKIALGATVTNAVGWIIYMMTDGGLLGMLIMAIGCIAGMISYVFGGFGAAMRMAGKIAKWGILVAPFPFCIMGVVLTFAFAAIAFVFVPIVPVRKAYKEEMLGQMA